MLLWGVNSVGRSHAIEQYDNCCIELVFCLTPFSSVICTTIEKRFTLDTSSPTVSVMTMNSPKYPMDFNTCNKCKKRLGFTTNFITDFTIDFTDW